MFEPSNQRFSVFHGYLDGQPLVAIVDVAVRDAAARGITPWFLSISTLLVDADSSGLPSTGDSFALEKWEEWLDNEIKGAAIAVFLGRVTWNGNRELLYYIDGPDACVNRLEELVASDATRAFAFRCERDDDWDQVKVYFEGNWRG